MPSYYNEIEPFAAQWLRNLVSKGYLPAGDVDERPIQEVQVSDLKNYHHCHFFAGIGGWALAAKLAGWNENFPLWTGSCPCQPFSTAGKQQGLNDDRHLWPYFYNLIEGYKPNVVFGEQVTGAVKHGWLDQVSDDLEKSGYTTEAFIIPARVTGALHRRNRLWFVAYSERDFEPWKEPCERVPKRVGRVVQPFPWNSNWKNTLRSFRALPDGLQRSVGGADAARNAIVPQVAAEILTTYLECLP